MVRIERRKNIGSANALTASANAKKKSRAKAAGSVSFANSLAGVAASENQIGEVEGLPENDPKINAREALGDISLLAIQEQSSNNNQKARKKAIELGEGLLKRLEDLHLRLIAESVSDDKLQQLEQFFAQKREHIQDHKLRDILAEIDLRVQVEIAKRRK